MGAKMLVLSTVLTVLPLLSAAIGYKRKMVDPSQWAPLELIENVHSLIQCGAICRWSQDCQAFCFDRDAKQCQLGPDLVADALPGSKEVYAVPASTTAVIAPIIVPVTTTTAAAAATTTTAATEEYTTLTTNIYYRAFSSDKSLQDAADICSDLGPGGDSMLAEMRNLEEIELFKQVMVHHPPHHEFWVGMNGIPGTIECYSPDNNCEDKVKWRSDQSTVVWTGQPGYPMLEKYSSGASESCFYWTVVEENDETDLLDDAYCDTDHKYFVCKYQEGSGGGGLPLGQPPVQPYVGTLSYKMLSNVNWDEAKAACHILDGTTAASLGMIRDYLEWNKLFTYLATLAPPKRIWVGFSKTEVNDICQNEACKDFQLKDILGQSIDQGWWPSGTKLKWTPEINLDQQTSEDRCISLVLEVGNLYLEDKECNTSAHAVCVKQVAD